MSLGFVATLRNNRLDEITALIDAGTGAGLLRIYTGPRPATGGAATTLLAELTLSDPSFPAAATGTMTANAVTGDTSADNTGTAVWFRIIDSDLNFVLDGSCGLSNSDLNLNSLDIVAGVPVDISSLIITDGNA